MNETSAPDATAVAAVADLRAAAPLAAPPVTTAPAPVGPAAPVGPVAARPVAVGQQHPRLVELVAAELRRLIVTGHWPQGERLVEGRVAEQLGVSRNPVREALRSLEAEGFVVLEPRRGARVAVLDAAEVGHLMEVRGALEELAAGLAARRRTDAHVAELTGLVAKGRAVAAGTDLAELPALNTRFHQLLTEASANPQLDALIGPLRDRIQWVYSTRVRERAPSSWEEHAAIAAAIAEGDEGGARRLAGEHIASATAAFLADGGPSAT
jgi:DNA-binding GntR family transcriptional regulator